MLCSYCQQVELTLEEAKSSKKGCMFCAMTSTLEMSKSMNMQIKMPKPIDYGRSQREYDDYLARIKDNSTKNSVQQKMNKAKQTMYPPGQSTSTPNIQTPGQSYDFSDDHIGRLLKSFDPNDPPFEFEEILSDDFYIKAAVPGPLDDKMAAMIEKEIKRLFTTIVYLKTQGSAWERYFRDPDEPIGPQGAFPQQG